MNSSRVRQNHPTEYCLTHYYVKLVSLLPASDIHPQKVAAEFLNPQERISKWRGIPRRHGDAVACWLDKTKIWIPLAYGKTTQHSIVWPIIM